MAILEIKGGSRIEGLVTAERIDATGDVCITVQGSDARGRLWLSWEEAHVLAGLVPTHPYMTKNPSGTLKVRALPGPRRGR